MKNFSIIPILPLITVVLAACSIQTANIPQELNTDTTYINNNLGIKFDYAFDNTTAKQEENKIVFYKKDTNDRYDEFIEIFNKSSDQTVEDSILDLVKKQGKDAKLCKVSESEPFYENKNFKMYFLDWIEQEITYTKEEAAEIKQADVDAKNDGGPFNGEFTKKIIENRRIIEICSKYAEPQILATSKSSRSIFLYNKEKSKTKFVFIPSSLNPLFFKGETLEILK